MYCPAAHRTGRGIDSFLGRCRRCQSISRCTACLQACSQITSEGEAEWGALATARRCWHSVRSMQVSTFPAALSFADNKVQRQCGHVHAFNTCTSHITLRFSFMHVHKDILHGVSVSKWHFLYLVALVCTSCCTGVLHYAVNMQQVCTEQPSAPQLMLSCQACVSSSVRVAMLRHLLQRGSSSWG